MTFKEAFFCFLPKIAEHIESVKIPDRCSESAATMYVNLDQFGGIKDPDAVLERLI